MIANYQTATYEDLLEDAREKSKAGNCYAAVVEITTYLSERTRMTVATGREKFKSHQNRGEFRAVVAQFYRGEPAYRPAAKPAPAPTRGPIDDDVLPF